LEVDDDEVSLISKMGSKNKRVKKMTEKKQEGGAASGTQYSATHDALMQTNELMSQRSIARKKP